MASKKVDTLQPQPEIRQHYMLLERCAGQYYKNNDTTDRLIRNLRLLFNDHGCDVDWFLNEFSNPKSRGITGSLSRIIIRGEKVVVQPSYTLNENADDYAVEISCDDLIRLANEWIELAKKKAPLIYIYHHNGKYYVSETLPEGIE